MERETKQKSDIIRPSRRAREHEHEHGAIVSAESCTKCVLVRGRGALAVSHAPKYKEDVLETCWRIRRYR